MDLSSSLDRSQRLAQFRRKVLCRFRSTKFRFIFATCDLYLDQSTQTLKIIPQCSDGERSCGIRIEGLLEIAQRHLGVTNVEVRGKLNTRVSVGDFAFFQRYPL